MSENEHPGIAAGWARLLSELEARNGSYAVLRLVRDPSRPRERAREAFSPDVDAPNRLEE